MEGLVELGHGNNPDFVFFSLVIIVIIGVLLLLILWRSAMIMKEMNQRMNDAQTQFNELRGEVKGFTQDLKPFFSNGGELIEDILKKQARS